MNINYKTLYSRTENGSIQQWQIVVDLDSFYTIEGIVGGKLTTSLPTICKPKNVGKVNETTGHDQANKEALAKIKKKKEQGYFENIEDIDNETFFQPMLAKKYEDEFHDNLFPVYAQPKLDGCRSIVTKKGMFSRTGKEFYSAPHIRKQLDWFFEKYPEAILDGELYCHKLNDNFNKIISLVKKSKPTEQDLKDSEEIIEYWIYDIPYEKKSYGARYMELKDKLFNHLPDNSKIKMVETDWIEDQEELDEHYGRLIEDGYEGQIIRIDGPYENKRTKNLLKRKEFQDSEYTILDIIEGEGSRTGTAGYMMFETETGIEFKSNIKGTFEYLSELIKNKESYIGKQATIKYFNLTPDKLVPRFPYVVAIRNYE